MNISSHTPCSSTERERGQARFIRAWPLWPCASHLRAKVDTLAGDAIRNLVHRRWELLAILAFQGPHRARNDARCEFLRVAFALWNVRRRLALSRQPSPTIFGDWRTLHEKIWGTRATYKIGSGSHFLPRKVNSTPLLFAALKKQGPAHC